MKYKPLHKTWRFWIGLLIPLTISAGIAITIYSVEGYELCYTSACFNGVLTAFKVPLAIAALVFPVIAIIIATHKSPIEVAQLQELIQNNSFNNYVKHREFIIEKINNLSLTSEVISITTNNTIYENMFSKNCPSSIVYTPDKTLLDILLRQLDTYVDFIIAAVTNGNDSNSLDSAVLLCIQNSCYKAFGGRPSNCSYYMKSQHFQCNSSTSDLLSDFKIFKLVTKELYDMVDLELAATVVEEFDTKLNIASDKLNEIQDRWPEQFENFLNRLDKVIVLK